MLGHDFSGALGFYRILAHKPYGVQGKPPSVFEHASRVQLNGDITIDTLYLCDVRGALKLHVYSISGRKLVRLMAHVVIARHTTKHIIKISLKAVTYNYFCQSSLYRSTP